MSALTEPTTPSPKMNFFFHFDSWRLNMRPGTVAAGLHLHRRIELEDWTRKDSPFQGANALVGIRLKGAGQERRVHADSGGFAADGERPERCGRGCHAGGGRAHVATPGGRQRRRTSAEDRAARAPGEVDKVLSTVVNNLIVTNNIDLQSDVRCRVLLTSPLESFTIGHTIVVSRGLLDVLPDEASLAMILAHEFSHIVLGHPFDTKLAFNDKMFFPDEQSFQRLDFRQSRGR